MRRTFPVPALLGSLLLAIVTATQLPAQQSGLGGGSRALTAEDYARWRTIEGARISADGRWVAYALRQANSLAPDQKPVLHLYDSQSGQTLEVPHAHSGEFSPDGRWIVYQVDSVPATRGGRGEGEAGGGAQAAQAAQPARTELRELATGRTHSWRSVQSAQFNATSTHLLLRRRAQNGGGGGGGGGGGRGGGAGGAQGAADMLLFDLASRNSLLLGSVGDAAFSRQGDLLAYTTEQPVRDANGLSVMDLATQRAAVLENDTLIYGRIRWSDDGNRIAALKGRPVERMRERDNQLVAFANVRQALQRGASAPAVLDRSASGFPQGFVITERAALSWSEDGRRVFFGIIPQTAAPDTARRPSRDSIADVDVWLTIDERIQSQQMIEADRDRNFTFTQAFDVVDGRFVPLADSTMRTVEISTDGVWAVGFDPRGYVADTARARADVYRVNTQTGERTLLARGLLTGANQFGISPDGRRFLHWQDNRYHAWDLASGTSRVLAGGEDGSFANAEWDYVGVRPAYGVEGYARDGSGVIVRDRYDLWLLPFSGAAARNLTNGEGARDEVRFRVVRTESVDSAAARRVRSGREIDLGRPLTLSAYGQWTKKSGFYRLAGGRLEPLVFEDANYGTPVRADKADRFLFARQTFTEFPDLRLSGASFTDQKKISDANPQQAEYVWGRRVLFDYENGDGVRLQGILALPDDYREGERRPMLVSFYEKNSQNMHQYPTPSFLTGMGSIPMVEALGRGYITMLADVHYRTGSSHSDQMESVEAATRKVIELGYADPARIGVHGHSYGGEGAAYIGVRSKMFAAVAMGAGVTDLTADFNQSWGWTYQVQGGSGQNGHNYYLYGQGRWGFSPWDNPERFREESAITHVRDAVSPILIMHGTADPTVSFLEGMNFYNALRFNGKNAVMLAYPEEGHGLRFLANRRDLTERYFDFFDHYLQGKPKAAWLENGVPYLVKVAGGGQ